MTAVNKHVLLRSPISGVVTFNSAVHKCKKYVIHVFEKKLIAMFFIDEIDV